MRREKLHTRAFHPLINGAKLLLYDWHKSTEALLLSRTHDWKVNKFFGLASLKALSLKNVFDLSVGSHLRDNFFFQLVSNLNLHTCVR
jgi:hypothetical protein